MAWHGMAWHAWTSNNQPLPRLCVAFALPGAAPSFSKAGQAIPRSIALQPFGGGVSMCPGRMFASEEIKLMVASPLSSFAVSRQYALFFYSVIRQRLAALAPPTAV